MSDRARRWVLRRTIETSIRSADCLHAEAAEVLRLYPDRLTVCGTHEGFDVQENKSRVYAGDWGEVASQLTGTHRATYLVLNMANPHQPGGGYFDGCPAQEENMWYRTDAHLTQALASNQRDVRARVAPYPSPLVAAVIGDRPLVCFKGREVPGDMARSFQPVTPFEFFEMRSAAVDTRGVDGARFDMTRYENTMRDRIRGQFVAARRRGFTHLLLGAFGCGAFAHRDLGPRISRTVARLYRDAVGRYGRDFTRVDFAIYRSGYGQGNYQIWRDEIARGAG